MPNDTQTYYSAGGPILIEYERAMRDKHLPGDLFNDYGFVIRAKAETGEDFHLWSFIYEQKGEEIIIDGDVGQTLLVYGKFSDEEKQYMHPTAPFVNKGQNIDDYYPPGSLQIKDEGDSVTWALGGRVHTGKPPHFTVTGTHAGVTANIVVRQTNPAFFHKGRFEDLAQNGGAAGYVAHCRASGTIEVHGRTLKFTDGHAIHERIVQSGYIPDRLAYMAGRGLNWMHGFSDNLTWYIIAGEGKRAGGMVNVGGEQIGLRDPAGAGVEELAHWVDPQSKVLQPYKWRVTMRTEKGTLEAVVCAYARAYYTWIRRGGVLIVNQYVANAEAAFTYTDGRVVKEAQMTSVEHMRTLYKQPLDQ